VEELFKSFKRLADRKKCVYDEDIEALVLGSQQVGPWRLDAISIHTDIEAEAQCAFASLKLSFLDQAPRIFSGRGDGPVNAIVNAMQEALGQALDLDSFQVNAVSAGSDAQGRATVRARIEGTAYQASGVSTDIVEASARALLGVVNRHCQRSMNHVPVDEPLAATG
jgi:2-isopropylmalate synthase